MSHYTQLHLQESKQQPNSKTTSPLAAEKKTAAVVGSFMIAAFASALLLGANACSKQADKNTHTSQPAISQPLTPVSATMTLPPATEPAAEPAVKGHAPGSYQNSSLGVSFQYPWQYSQKKGKFANLDSEGNEIVPMNFVQTGGIALSTVEIPQGYFPDTDFVSAYFNLSVNPKLNAEECSQFSLFELDHDVSKADKVKVGEMEFSRIKSDVSGPDVTYYHAFQNGVCYEFALGMQTDDFTENVKPVSRAKVFRRLESMLATVQIDSLEAPETSTQTASAPAAATETPTEVPHP
ncbi:MAG: hypothetical protein JST79_14910 [Acidobacteria bacterium]|nr:hypothetical protein [Acidobacteriota bacterium]